MRICNVFHAHHVYLTRLPGLLESTQDLIFVIMAFIITYK
jgi:hypothetical protein